MKERSVFVQIPLDLATLNSTFERFAIVPKLNIVLEGQEFEDRMDYGDDEGQHQEVDVGLQEGFLDGVLVVVLLLFAHESAHHVETVLHLLRGVHLPFEHAHLKRHEHMN